MVIWRRLVRVIRSRAVRLQLLAIVLAIRMLLRLLRFLGLINLLMMVNSALLLRRFRAVKTYIVNDNEFENAHAQGQWCLLSLNVSNVQNDAQEFSASDQYLYDDSGKQFSADTVRGQ